MTVPVATGAAGAVRLAYDLLGATLDAGSFPPHLWDVGQFPPSPWRQTVTLGLPNSTSTSLDAARACCTSCKGLTGEPAPGVSDPHYPPHRPGRSPGVSAEALAPEAAVHRGGPLWPHCPPARSPPATPPPVRSSLSLERAPLLLAASPPPCDVSFGLCMHLSGVFLSILTTRCVAGCGGLSAASLGVWWHRWEGSLLWPLVLFEPRVSEVLPFALGS